MTRSLHGILTLTLLALLLSPALAQQPTPAEPDADIEAVERGPGPRQPHRPGHRPSRPLTEEQTEKILDFAKENLPAVYQRLESLRESSPQRYQRTLRRMLPRIAHLMKMTPEQRKTQIELSRLRMEIFKLARQYNQATDDEARQTLREKLLALLGEQFELEQTLRREKLKEMETLIERLRDEINQRAQQKDTHVEAQLEKTLEHVQRFGQKQGDPPGPSRRRRPRPEQSAPQTQPAE
jgi:hypothetical protein